MSAAPKSQYNALKVTTGEMSASMTWGILLRLALVAALLLPLAVLAQEPLVHAALPYFSQVFEWVADDFRLLRLVVDQEGADRVLRATVTWKHIVVIGGHEIYPDARGTASSSTLLAHALSGPLTALIAVCAWPTLLRSRAWIEANLRCLALMPLLVLQVLIDLPIVLAGEIWAKVLNTLDPGAMSLLVIWKDFMQSGGRYACGLVSAVLAIKIGRFGVIRLSAARG